MLAKCNNYLPMVFIGVLGWPVHVCGAAVTRRTEAYRRTSNNDYSFPPKIRGIFSSVLQRSGKAKERLQRETKRGEATK